MEELQELAKLEGFESNAEDLEAMAGGSCPYYGCPDFDKVVQPCPDNEIF